MKKTILCGAMANANGVQTPALLWRLTWQLMLTSYSNCAELQ